MPRNEQGEYELVLGTPQLLSMLFIIVVLFGVVFSLGYFMGRSTAPAGPAAQGPPAGTAEEKLGARPEPAGQALPPATQPEAVASEQEGAQATGTTPAGATPAPAPTPWTPETKPAVQASAETQAASVPPSSAGGQPSAPAAEAAAKSYPEPAPGQTFLQVAAVTRNEAELAVDMLKRRGFAALVAPGPNERLFRVLVGPLGSAEEIAKTRKALEEAGFRSAYVRKY